MYLLFQQYVLTIIYKNISQTVAFCQFDSKNKVNLPICFFEISVVLSIFFVRQLGIRHKHRGE
ncbi:hypothetical protein HMPREF1545_02234 [Oscillibacter sp. KLE 1728]|nr:hypothetical protein HMPREF1545_02234 [Oscillibacter sp. KLE 1728]ERK62863.1 hypothetical protein HMPREF1546_02466 [Oscillibacter sp. KLE 1745]